MITFEAVDCLGHIQYRPTYNGVMIANYNDELEGRAAFAVWVEAEKLALQGYANSRRRKPWEKLSWGDQVQWIQAARDVILEAEKPCQHKDWVEGLLSCPSC